MRIIGACAATALVAVGCASIERSGEDSPRLIVLIVADQMSDDLLDRHGEHLTGGFRRLLDEGRRFENAVVDHAPTNSLPGHLSAASGAYPRRHGIVDNSWAEPGPNGIRHVGGFDDPGCPIVASEGVLKAEKNASQGIGPSRFESPTIVEWTLATNAGARFASLGVGGGVSALHAGKAKGPVFWYDPDVGEFVTSACYGETLPAWVQHFNASLAESFMGADWTLAAPEAMLAPLGPDDASYENSGSDFEFPHRRPPEQAARRAWFNFTPFVDIAMLTLAKEALRAEHLGVDDTPDILTIGLSSLDHVGHHFGPTSVEQADTLWRLDQALGDLFGFLDEIVGEDRWAVALTADHGAPPAPEDATRWGIAGARRVSIEAAGAAIERIVAAAEAARASGNNAASATARAALERDFVARALTQEEIAAAGETDDPILRLYANSYWPGRTSLHPLYSDERGRSPADYGVIVIPDPYVVIDWAASIHGSPYAYDREVEMIFMGPDVERGQDRSPVRTIDVAPTLAGMAGVKPIAPVDGVVLDLRGRAGQW